MMAKPCGAGKEKRKIMSSDTLSSSKGTRPLGWTKARALVAFACFLSAGSMGWTTWSMLDLLKVGAIGLTVALTADVIWSAVIYAEYAEVGHPVLIKITGWVTNAIVGAFIAWHGYSENNLAMAAAGPFLTLGAKAVWEIALSALRDPTALSRKEREELYAAQRKNAYLLKKQEIEANAQMQEDSLAAEIELNKVKLQGKIAREALLGQKEEIKLKRDTDRELESSGYRLVRMDDVVAGQVLPQSPRLDTPQAPRREIDSGAYPEYEEPDDVDDAFPASSSSARTSAAEAAPPRTSVTVHLDELTEKQREHKLLVAEWVAMRNAGRVKSQVEFARQKGIGAPQLSRIIRKYEQDLTVEEIEAVAAAVGNKTNMAV
jgi:hypothetical protein